MIAKKVKKTMIDRDITVTNLAKITGYTRGHLSNVINGRIDSIKVKKVIALALDKKFSELWNGKEAGS
jgi:DNA-binding Xre family transcriptional regulator